MSMFIRAFESALREAGILRREDGKIDSAKAKNAGIGQDVISRIRRGLRSPTIAKAEEYASKMGKELVITFVERRKRKRRK